MTPSEQWLWAHPGSTLNDYVQAMQISSPSAKRERFRAAMRSGEPTGYFKWLKTDDNGFVVAVWGLLASMPLFGLAMVVVSIWSRR
jgi:hypothetical protein